TAGTAAVAGSVPASAGSRFPASISIPNGFQPEGFTIGRGTSFYVGSLAGGAVFRGDLATGHGAILVPPTDGAAKTGLKVDRHNRLWACTADGGGAAVYDARTGALLAPYRFEPAGRPARVLGGQRRRAGPARPHPVGDPQHGQPGRGAAHGRRVPLRTPGPRDHQPAAAGTVDRRPVRPLALRGQRPVRRHAAAGLRLQRGSGTRLIRPARPPRPRWPGTSA